MNETATHETELHQKQVKLGQSYAPEFVDAMASTAHLTIREYLEDHQAPEQLVHLVDHAIMLERVTQELRAGALNEWDAGWLIESLAEITTEIVQLGGTFMDSQGNFPKLRDPIPWEPSTPKPIEP